MAASGVVPSHSCHSNGWTTWMKLAVLWHGSGVCIASFVSSGTDAGRSGLRCKGCRAGRYLFCAEGVQNRGLCARMLEPWALPVGLARFEVATGAARRMRRVECGRSTREQRPWHTLVALARALWHLGRRATWVSLASQRSIVARAKLDGRHTVKPRGRFCVVARLSVAMKRS